MTAKFMRMFQQEFPRDVLKYARTMTCIDLRDEVVVNLRALVVVFVVVATSVEVHSPRPRSPWPRQSKGSDVICRMLRWTRRNDRSLMQTVLANFLFLLV
jgi:hypothetical protein